MSFLIHVIQESSYIEDHDVFPNPGDSRIHLHEVTHTLFFATIRCLLRWNNQVKQR